MEKHKDGEGSFLAAREIIRRGDFDETKECLEAIGFIFVRTTDPNHWMYYHPELRADPIFRYPRNFYRPHGTRRSSDRISRHDQSQAKQALEALRIVRGTGRAREEADQ